MIAYVYVKCVCLCVCVSVSMRVESDQVGEEASDCIIELWTMKNRLILLQVSIFSGIYIFIYIYI